MTKTQRTLIWLAIGLLGLSASAWLAVAILNWRAQARLERQYAAIRAAGDPLTLAELARDPIPPEQNAFTFLRRAEKDLNAIQSDLEPLFGEDSSYYKDGKLTEEGARLIRDAFDAYPDVLPLIEKAADCPDYVSPLDLTQESSRITDLLTPHIRQLRCAPRVLEQRVYLLLYEGDRDEGLKTSLDILRLARHYDQEPFIVSYLVALAVRSVGGGAVERVIEDGPLSAESRQLLEEELARHDSMQGFVWCLKSARVSYTTQFQSTLPWLTRSLWLFKNDHCDFLDIIGEEVEMGAAPRYEREPQIEALDQRAMSKGRLSSLSYPPIRMTREAVDRTRAYLRCLRVLNALQAHIERTGAAPASLEQLALPANVITDPYNGNPLLTKRTPEGWIVYSVGRNKVDDGGKIELPLEDVGAGPIPVPSQ